MNILNTLILFRVLDNIFPHFFLTEERNTRKERPRKGKNRAAVLSLSTPTLRFMRCAATQWQTVGGLYCQKSAQAL